MATNRPCKLAAISWRLVTLILKKSPVNRLKIRACSKSRRFCGGKSPRNLDSFRFLNIGVSSVFTFNVAVIRELLMKKKSQNALQPLHLKSTFAFGFAMTGANLQVCDIAENTYLH